MDFILGICFIIYYLCITISLTGKKLVNIRKRIWDTLDQQNPDPSRLLKIWRHFVKRFIPTPPGHDHHPAEIQIIPSETDLNNSKLAKNDKQHLDEKDLPHTLQHLDTEVKPSRSNRYESKSVEESTDNVDMYRSALRPLNNSDEVTRIGSIRGTQIDFLKSHSRSRIFTKTTLTDEIRNSIILPSQTLETEEEGLFQPETSIQMRKFIQRQEEASMEDPPTAASNKVPLEEPRCMAPARVPIRKSDNTESVQQTNSWSQNNESDRQEQILSLYDILWKKAEPPQKEDEYEQDEPGNQGY